MRLRWRAYFVLLRVEFDAGKNIKSLTIRAELLLDPYFSNTRGGETAKLTGENHLHVTKYVLAVIRET